MPPPLQFERDPFPDYQLPGGEERVHKATLALLGGDVPVAWRSLLSPASLTIEERYRLLRKINIQPGSWQERVLAEITNPALLISLALTMAFPITGRAISKIHKSLKGLEGKLPFLKSMSSPMSLYRGTPILDHLIGVTGHKNAFQNEVGGKFVRAFQGFRKSTGREMSSVEEIMVAASLDGLGKPLRGYTDDIGVLIPGLSAKVSGVLQETTRGIREGLELAIKKVAGTPKLRTRLQRALEAQKRSGITSPSADDEYMATLHQWRGTLKDYFPHRVTTNQESLRQVAGIYSTPQNSKVAEETLKRRLITWVGPELKTRKWRAIPSLEHLDELAKDGLVDPAVLTKLKNRAKKVLLDAATKRGVSSSSVRSLGKLEYDDMIADYGHILQRREAETFGRVMLEDALPQYSLRLTDTLEPYVRSMASTFSFSSSDIGRRLLRFGRILKEKVETNPRAAYRYQKFLEVDLPGVMGRSTPSISIQRGLAVQRATEMAAWLDKPGVKRFLGDKVVTSFQKRLKGGTGLPTGVDLANMASSYIYTSTLGASATSSFANISALVLTTGPFVGFSNLAKGLGAMTQKMSKYANLRMGSRQLNHLDAYAESFPEFARMGLGPRRGLSGLISETIQKTTDGIINLGPLSKVQKIQKVFMAPFKLSEFTVQLGAFEAGLAGGRSAGLTGKKLSEFALRTVHTTQFLTGPAATPYFLGPKGLFTEGAPPFIKQFAQFPARFLEFGLRAGEAGLGGLIGSGKSYGGFNPGTFARMYLSSRIFSEAARFADVDVSNWLLAGAIPAFQEKNRVLSPIPFVSPVVQIGSEIIFSLQSGSFRNLRRVLPLAIPGGTSLAKLAEISPERFGLGKTVGRGFIDYTSPDAEGKYTLFDVRGRPKAQLSPFEIMRMGLGFRPLRLRQQGELLQMIRSERRRITESRAEYLDAVKKNNWKKASSLNREFKKRFGFPIPITKSNIRDTQRRREIPRLTLALKGLPPGVPRQRIAQLLGIQFGEEVQTSLLGTQTPPGRPGRQTVRRTPPASAPGVLSLTPIRMVSPYEIGRRRGGRIPDFSGLP